MRIALVMREEDAVAGELLRVAARDEVDEEAAVADAVDRRGLARKMGRRREARAQRGEKLQPLGERRQRRGDDPGVLAMRADGDQRAAEAEPVGGLRDLLQIGEIGGAIAVVRAEIGAVAADGNEPEQVERFVGRS